jgi:hypothetical protein
MTGYNTRLRALTQPGAPDTRLSSASNSASEEVARVWVELKP